MDKRHLTLFRQKYIIDEDGCCIWIGAQDRDGYGIVWNNGKRRQAHIVSYEHFVGLVPEGMELDHLCRKRACVNWHCLEPVTHRENVQRGYDAKMEDLIQIYREVSGTHPAGTQPGGFSERQNLTEIFAADFE